MKIAPIGRALIIHMTIQLFVIVGSPICELMFLLREWCSKLLVILLNIGEQYWFSSSRVDVRGCEQGLTGSRYPTRPELFFKYPTHPDPKIENDWVPGNKISFGKQ